MEDSFRYFFMIVGLLLVLWGILACFVRFSDIWTGLAFTVLALGLISLGAWLLVSVGGFGGTMGIVLILVGITAFFPARSSFKQFAEDESRIADGLVGWHLLFIFGLIVLGCAVFDSARRGVPSPLDAGGLVLGGFGVVAGHLKSKR